MWVARCVGIPICCGRVGFKSPPLSVLSLTCNSLLNVVGCAFCQQQFGAVAGLSVTIPCDHEFGRQNEAPFWIINGIVYELFSIPRNFPFIPVIESYVFLNIPFVYLALNQSTYQCIAFDTNGAVNGSFVQLIVFPSMFSM